MTTKITIALIFLISTFVSQAQNTVIKAGHFFDARSGKMVDNQTIIIQNGKIKEVGTNLKINKTDTVIDLSNSWVLPGLMDCHVHITSNLSYRKRNWNDVDVTESNALRAIRGSVVARQFLDNGFTTIKEIGNDANYATADIIKAIKNGWIQGPTIIYAGKIIAPYGGQSWEINPEHEHFWDWEYIDADTHEEIIKAIRKNVYYGATVIKMVSGDNGIYDAEDIKVAVTEAKKFGLKVTVHVKMGGQEATNVILGGAAAIEHGFGLDNTQLQLMKDKGTFLVGTDFSFDNWYAYGFDSTKAKSWVNIDIDRLKRAYAIGTKMAFGTDIVIDLPGLNRVQSNLKILENWKLAGIPPSYILQCMTTNAAELLGVENSRGVLEKSYYADIIALKNNPLDDIDAIKTVQFVMKEGKVIRRD
ncbi:MAG: amidohydrolase family protein [Ferruginibacter sp.]